MKTVLFALIALFLAALPGCSSYRIVRNEADNSATWSTYRTFAFVDTNRIESTPRDAYQAAVEQVKQAVTAELNNRGYQQISDYGTTARPDLLVNLGSVVKEKTQTRPTTIYEAPRYIGQRRYSWRSQEVPVGTYQEGTVSLHVVDAQRNALLWDVAVTSVLNRRSISSVQIGEAVAKVFENFPGKRP